MMCTLFHMHVTIQKKGTIPLPSWCLHSQEVGYGRERGEIVNKLK